MAEIYQVTGSSFQLFRPLLTEEAARSFATDPDVLAVGAVEENEAAGIMLLKLSDLRVFLSYLYVSEVFRRRGIGADLLCRAKELALKSDRPLEAPFYSEDGKDPLYLLFATRPGYDLVPMGNCFFRMPIEELKEMKKRIPKRKNEFSLRFFSKLSLQERRSFENLCRESGQAYFDPYAKDYFEPLCLAAVKDGMLKAVLLSTFRDGELEISYVTGTSPFALMELFRAVPDIAAKTLWDKAKTLRIATVNESSEKIVRFLFPTAEPAGAYFMAGVDIYEATGGTDYDRS